MSMTSPTFSVIIPVYNVEDYVAECLDSVLAQTFTDFEIIAIDDGSPDGSANIVERYARQDSRIHLIHQQNAGLSASRNKGVAQARGNYCLFVDSDDVVHPQLLEICHHFLRTYRADFVSFNYEKITPHAGLPASRHEPEAMRYHLSRNPYPLLSQRHRHRIPLMAQNSCYSIELARKHPFIEGMLYEDYPHTVCLMRDVGVAVSLQQKLYGYTTRPGSIMTKRFSAGNVAHYRRGMLSIADAYRDDAAKFAVVSRIIYPEFLKQIGNVIFRIKDRDEAWMDMLRAFRSLLSELNERGILRWRGHKLSRYTAYRKLLRTPEGELSTIVPQLDKVFH